MLVSAFVWIWKSGFLLALRMLKKIKDTKIK